MYARDRFLLQQSPMGRTSWAKVQFTMKVVTEAFDSAPQACLEVSALLAAELNPIFVGEERTRSDQGRLAYFATEFSQKVKQAMVSMAEHFPWAGRLSLDFSGGGITESRGWLAAE
jgi:hypothetical protein